LIGSQTGIMNFPDENRFASTRQILKCLFGVLFVLAGANHFIHTGFYVNIMPSYLPWHTTLVYVSGAAEMVLGILLLFRRTERLAAWGMIALIIAVTPANIQMAVHPELYPDYSHAALLARLPLQGVLIIWAFWFTRPRPDQPGNVSHHTMMKD
jgi:uncharacterized membrane protein